MATRTRKPKQPKFPGMEDPTFRDIDDAAEHYVEERDARIALSRKEKEANQNLIDKMTEHGLELYKLPDGQKVIMLGKKDIRVEKAKAPEANGDGEE